MYTKVYLGERYIRYDANAKQGSLIDAVRVVDANFPYEKVVRQVEYWRMRKSDVRDTVDLVTIDEEYHVPVVHIKYLLLVILLLPGTAAQQFRQDHCAQIVKWIFANRETALAIQLSNLRLPFTKAWVKLVCSRYKENYECDEVVHNIDGAGNEVAISLCLIKAIKKCIVVRQELEVFYYKDHMKEIEEYMEKLRIERCKLISTLEQHIRARTTSATEELHVTHKTENAQKARTTVSKPKKLQRYESQEEEGRRRYEVGRARKTMLEGIARNKEAAKARWAETVRLRSPLSIAKVCGDLQYGFPGGDLVDIACAMYHAYERERGGPPRKVGGRREYLGRDRELMEKVVHAFFAKKKEREASKRRKLG